MIITICCRVKKLYIKSYTNIAASGFDWEKFPNDIHIGERDTYIELFT